MSEPLERFLEREFKGEKLQEILKALTEGGDVSEVEDLYLLNEDDLTDLGIKVIPRRKIMAALKVSLNLLAQFFRNFKRRRQMSNRPAQCQLPSKERST